MKQKITLLSKGQEEYVKPQMKVVNSKVRHQLLSGSPKMKLGSENAEDYSDYDNGYLQ